MTSNITQIRSHIQNFAFEDLFIDELGWDQYRNQLEIVVENDTITLDAFVEKRGMVVFTVKGIPEYKIRRKIEQQVAKVHRENMIIYVDDEQTEQIWQWVRREPGKPLANRERKFHQGHSGELIAQVLAGIAFSLEEEDELNLVGVTSRVRMALNVETNITKKFYDRFKKQHDAFLKFIDGIPDSDFKRWYASVMLNRIMFIYFLQYKGFLDGDRDYLGKRLKKSEGNFYRDFLIPLFFEGFAKKDHSREIKQLLGDVPYLNGGLFLPHQVEEHYGDDIAIPDDAFEKLFDFFDDYQWHLDDRPLHKDTEINPDVLGYIFEKYINDENKGAYYTKEDITEYISKNTVIPFLFDEALKVVKIAFEGEHTVWDLLVENPNRYIYPAVQHGTQLELPDEIAVGIDDVSQREQWNTLAPSDYGLPTEIWRETVARRQRYFDIHGQLKNGEIRQINDLITLNLDMQQFAQDVLNYTDSPDVIRAFWKALNRVTVLDPTCGSGAFLFAALNILEPMYEACLERMEGFLSELDENAHPQKYSDFREVMARIDQHPNRTYFILKSIIIQNLYGVDIMAEAIEIAKLRLFLKLMSQVDDKNKIEPLPDIDFNIRAGNTLVGFATQDEVRQALRQTSSGQMKLISTEDQDSLAEIEIKAQDIDRLFGLFRQQQTELGGEVHPEDKAELKRRLAELENELNQLLARQYGVDPNKQAQYDKWRKSHEPFHWFTEFYGVLKTGGFDVIIGNPPYVEYYKVRKFYQIPSGVYQSEKSTNLFAYVIERSTIMLTTNGRQGLIVPLSLVCTQRMEYIQNVLLDFACTWHSNYAERPSKLFSGAEVLLSISILEKRKSNQGKHWITGLQKWYSDARNTLFELTTYTHFEERPQSYIMPKISDAIEQSIITKFWSNIHTLEYTLRKETKQKIYYRIGGGRYWKIFTSFQPYFALNGEKSVSSRESYMYFDTKLEKDIVIATLSSTVFFWYFIVTTNGRDLNPSDLKKFPINISDMDLMVKNELADLSEELMRDYQIKKARKTKTSKRTGEIVYEEFYPRLSKHIIDEIDRVLARHYGFTDEELDFIINYDIKYRMGSELFDGDGDA